MLPPHIIKCYRRKTHTLTTHDIFIPSTGGTLVPPETATLEGGGSGGGEPYFYSRFCQPTSGNVRHMSGTCQAFAPFCQAHVRLFLTSVRHMSGNVRHPGRAMSGNVRQCQAMSGTCQANVRQCQATTWYFSKYSGVGRLPRHP